MTTAVLHTTTPVSDLSRLEPVKWLAFFAMVLDHIGVALFPEVSWLHQVGRFAFPAFVISFGIGLASSRDPFEAGSRLFAPALVAQVAWEFINGSAAGVNVLAVCSASAIAIPVVRELWRGGGDLRVLAIVLVFILFALSVVVPVEGGLAGVLLIAGGYLAALGVPYLVWAVSALWLVMLPSLGFALGVAAALHTPRTFHVPHVRGLFAWAYAAHLAVLAALKALQ